MKVNLDLNAFRAQCKTN